MKVDFLLWLALATALVPGVLGFALSRCLDLSAWAARGLAAASAWLAALGALGCAAWVAVGGSAAGAVLASDALPAGLGLGAHVDGLTALVLVTVTAIGASVARYSVRYLDGDPAQARFSQWLAFTLSGALLTIVSSNLAMFLAASVATSHGLHRLLCHASDRPGAVLAARQKFLIARLGDTLLLAACVVAYGHFGSVDFASMAAVDEAAAATSSATSWIAWLLVGWALTQTAQFPFHTWLPNTMEAPTPVSALMHAGIVNAGGFLLIRCSPVLVQAPSALMALALLGTLTAVFGALVMLTQTEIKGKYAYSTVSQMGFMMLQCGLGAFGAAALHLVGHSFYKGHAFLTAGTAVDPEPPSAPARAPVPAEAAVGPGPGVAALAGAAVVGVAAALTAVGGLGSSPTAKPGALLLASILALAVGQMIRVGSGSPLLRADALPATRRRLVRDIAAGSVALVLLYFAGAFAAGWIVSDALPPAAAIPALPAALGAAILLAFAGAMVIQEAAARAVASSRHAGRWHAAYIHLRQGLYVGVLQDRLVARLWPPRRTLDSASPEVR